MAATTAIVQSVSNFYCFKKISRILRVFDTPIGATVLWRITLYEAMRTARMSFWTAVIDLQGATVAPTLVK